MALKTEPPPPPDWFFELLDEQPPKAASNEKAEKIHEGERNDHLYRRGCGMRAKGADFDEIYDKLLILNKERCDPPLDGEEVKQIALSASTHKPTETDPSVILTQAGFDALTKDSPPAQMEAALRKLAITSAMLDPLARELVRELAIKRLSGLGIKSPARVIDAAMKPTPIDAEIAANAIFPPPPESWPEPVDGQQLVEELSDTFLRFLYLPDEAELILALWVLHAHAFQAFYLTPYLSLNSPEKGCGKTTAIELLSCLLPKPLIASNITPAALFRAVEKYQPTLLVDEADTFLKMNDELRGIVNSGNRRLSAFVIRAVGDDHEPCRFSTWCPKIIALIGNLPDTVWDRSIEITMDRKPPNEKVENFDPDKVFAELEMIRRKIKRWTDDNLDKIREADPECPPQLRNRTRDKWKILFKIGAVIGEDLLKKIQTISLTFGRSNEDESIRIQLLQDIKHNFALKNTDRLSSQDLVNLLVNMEDRLWPEYKRETGITATQIARLLKPFHIRPKQIWFEEEGKNRRGYHYDDFDKVFESYLSPEC